MGKMGNFISGVKKEIKRIKWPTKKEMVKYSSATLLFILFFAIFFFIIDLVFSFINSLRG